MTKVLVTSNRFASLFQSILALADEASQTGTRSVPAGQGLNEFDLDALLELFDRAGNLRTQLAFVMHDAMQEMGFNIPERIARITQAVTDSEVFDRQPQATTPVENSAPALSLSSASVSAPDEPHLTPAAETPLV